MSAKSGLSDDGLTVGRVQVFDLNDDLISDRLRVRETRGKRVDVARRVQRVEKYGARDDVRIVRGVLRVAGVASVALNQVKELKLSAGSRCGRDGDATRRRNAIAVHVKGGEDDIVDARRDASNAHHARLAGGAGIRAPAC